MFSFPHLHDRFVDKLCSQKFQRPTLFRTGRMIRRRLDLLRLELCADVLAQLVEILDIDETSRDEHVAPLQLTLPAPSFELYGSCYIALELLCSSRCSQNLPGQTLLCASHVSVLAFSPARRIDLPPPLKITKSVVTDGGPL